ncbi:hypothetical protein DICSQDRAFT_25821, partial [Dichomitus squalens LYAD-421 SS1]
WETGVEEFQEYNTDALWGALGLADTRLLPSFNPVQDARDDASERVDPWDTENWASFLASGEGVKLEPRWHQLVGLVKIMRHVIEGKPLLLMDQVGVGKTLQIVAAITTYGLFHRYFQTHKKFPGAYAGMRAPTPDGNLPDVFHLVCVPPSLFIQWQQEIRRYVKHGAVDLFPYEG